MTTLFTVFYISLWHKNDVCFSISAAASGVGGGAVYSTLYIFLFHLMAEAIPLSKVAVMGAAICFFIFHISTPVPSSITGHANRFAYDAVMIMEPATLLGTVYGVLASRMCPYWLIVLLMAFLLSLAATKTFRKANKLRGKEGAASVQIAPLSSVRHAFYGSTDSSKPLQKDEAEAAQPKEIRDHEGHCWGLIARCILSVGVCFAAVLVGAELTRAVSAGEDVRLERLPRFECGGLAFWAVIVVTSLVCAGATVSNVRYLVAHSPWLVRQRQCSMVWDRKSAHYYAWLCLAAGFLSSFCGIGGSTIKGPILLEMGLNPTLAKATSQLMLLSTVSSSAFQFYTVGNLPAGYAGVFFAIAVFASFAGKLSIDVYIARGGRQSVIVYLLAIYIVISAVLMTGLGGVLIVGQLYPTVNWSQLLFRSFCAPMPSEHDALRLLE